MVEENSNENNFSSDKFEIKSIRKSFDNLGFLKKYALTLFVYLFLTYTSYFIHKLIVPPGDTMTELIKQLAIWNGCYFLLFNFALGLLFKIKIKWTIFISPLIILLQLIVTKLIFYNMFSYDFYSSWDTTDYIVKQHNTLHYLSLSALLTYIFQHTFHFITWTVLSKIKKLHIIA